MKTLLARIKVIDPVKALRESKLAATKRRGLCAEALQQLNRGELIQQRDALAAKWVNTRHARDLAELVAVEQRLLVSTAVEQAISNAIQRVEAAEAKGSADLVRVAFEAISTAVEDERQSILAADAKRSEELGVEVSSVRAIEALDRKAEQLRTGRGQLLSRQPDMALSSLFTVVGD